MSIKARGKAGFTVDLSDGVITVRHIECKSKLACWTANMEDWDILWKTIRDLESNRSKYKLLD
tara:strand:- start:269 stop:457 length:189 start_codon:yes stop_codon:yes gene_type:complete